MKGASIKVTMVLVSVLVALVLAEVLVRAFLPFNTPESVKRHSMSYVPTVYATYLIEPLGRLVDIDSAKAWGEKAPDAPSDLQIFISANGYRGPAFDVRKPEGTVRILIVGGSAVFDQNASDPAAGDSAAWPRLVQQALHQAGHTDVEVINAGIPGQTSADSLGRLYTQLWTYEPDFVLLYHGWNDMKFWKRFAVSPEKPLIGQVRPFDPTKNPFTHYQGNMDRWLANSQLYVKLRNRYLHRKIRVGPEGALEEEQPLGDTFADFGPRQFRLNLELFVRACQVIGATPVLVTQATLADPDSSDADRARIGYAYLGLDHGGMLKAFDRSYRIIRDVGGQTDTHVIDAAQMLNGRSDLFQDHVHTNHQGSRELASIVATQLQQILRKNDSGNTD